MREKIKNFFSKKDIRNYVKIFLIPTFLFIIIMCIGSDNIQELYDSTMEMLIIIFMWFILSFPMTSIYMRLKNLKIIKLFSENFIYLCLIINFLMFIFLRYIFIIEDTLKSIVFTLLVFIPTLFSLILILIKKRKNIKNSIINFIQTIFILIFSVYMFIIIIVGSFIMAIDGVDNVKKYKKVCSLYKISIAPNNIPNNAKNINFHYNNSFLQGGEIFYLYFKTDHKTIKKYKEKYVDLAKWVKEYNSINNNYYYLKNEYIEDCFNKKIENLKIYYLDGYCDNSGYCNHGAYEAIGIDDISDSIIFYYEKW